METEGQHYTCGKEPQETGRYWGSEPAEYYPRFLSSAPEALPSPHWLYLYYTPFGGQMSHQLHIENIQNTVYQAI